MDAFIICVSKAQISPECFRREHPNYSAQQCLWLGLDGFSLIEKMNLNLGRTQETL